MVRTVCCAILVSVTTPAAFGIPVKLRAVAATAPSATGHSLEAAINDSFAPANGWSIQQGLSEEQFAVFAVDGSASASLYQFQFFFLDPAAPSHFGDFGVSVTSDENPSLQSTWVPLLPDQATANDINSIKITGRTVRLNSTSTGVIVTVRARAPFTGVTGFRLRLRPVNHPDGSQRSIGCAPDGSFLLTQFTVEAVPLHSTDIALGCEVYSSGPVPPDLPKENLTDGLIGTYTHPDPSVDGQHFFFTLDLGRVVELDHIVVHGRRDVSGLNRLGGYRIVILDDSGQARRLTKWAAEMHLDGSHSADDTDIFYQRNGVGAFVGRAIRIYNQPGESLQPELAELEVYPALKPRAEDWFADDIKLKTNGPITVPPDIHRLAFTIATHQAGIIPDLLNYRWRIPGWSEQWRETGPGGHVELVPPPPPGTFHLQVQAQHTDGLWDESGQSLSFHVVRAWWRDPLTLAAIDTGAVILMAAVAWQFLGWRKNRRLALAEQHLELYRERLRIARDMHDDVGARLTYIALLADRVQRETHAFGDASGNPLERLAENARSAVSALDNIVWAVNPSHDTVGSLADYLCEYAPIYLQAAGIECVLDFQVSNPQHPLGLTVRHGLLMAVKEALQNVVKHSAATSVRLAFREQKGQVEISVSDNGRGMNPETPDAVEHSGLGNMRQRLAELGGQCEVASQNGNSGTCVRFILPVNHHLK